MRSQFARAVRWACLVAAFGVHTAAASADSIFSDAEARHGRIVQLDTKGIVFVEGCGKGPETTVGWDTIDDAVFDGRCEAGGVRPTAAGGGVCGTKVSTRFLLFGKQGGTPVVADQVTLTRDGIFHYADHSKNVVGHGPVMDLAGVSFRQICEDDVATGPPPPSFCTEPMQFAANFSYDAPLANQVLTRGFSFHTDFLPSEDAFPQLTREAIVATIRTGFGTALTNWFSGLLQRRSNYDPRLQAFIDTLVSRSPAGFTMLIPPQVVALKCPQAATFIVRIYANHDGPFAADKERKAAYASKPGRTLVLNFSDYPCWNQGYFKYVFDATSRCINIDSILTHELGHAFGLDHVREADSIMTQFIQVTKPSDRDVDRLAAQLLLTVQGGAPGSIVFTTDNGVAVEEQR